MAQRVRNLVGRIFFWGWVVFALAVPVTAMVDLDGDGMSDVWELFYNAGDLLPDEDEDQDRNSNAGESITGTDPFDPTSFVRVDSIRAVPSGVEMNWETQPGKSYTLFGNLLLRPDHWEPIRQLNSDRSGATATVVSNTTPLRAVDPLAENETIAESERVYFRMDVADLDGDGDGVTDWEEGILGLDPNRAETSPGVADFDAAVAAVQAPNEITIRIEPATIPETGMATVTVSRAGNFNAVEVPLAASGTLRPGEDVEPLPTRIHFPRFVNETNFVIVPTGLGFPGQSETLTLTVVPGAGYVPVNPAISSLVVTFEESTAFAASLVPAADAFSPLEGTAILAVSPSRTSGELQLTLNGPSTSPALATFQDNGVTWQMVGEPAFDSTIFPLTPADIDRLQQGEVTVLVTTADGQSIRGTFYLANGEQPFEPPTDLPPIPGEAPTVEQASRFLTQASMGPTRASIAEVQNLGFEGWLDAQMALPVSRQVPWMQLREDAGLPLNQGHRIERWWFNAVWGQDTLRQRVAQNLSNLFVVSDRGSDLIQMHFAVASYHDLLAERCFGNARDLLAGISRHPAMGVYLSHIRNRRQIGTTFPDENYAREIMQLFSIGLWKLHPDGSRIPGEDGRPIPTYNQQVVENMARVFTGWSYASDDPGGFWRAPVNETELMTAYADFHDDGEKELWDDVVLPGGQGAEQDLEDVIDALVRHPNTAPFLCRQFIQRLVTANPSRAYVYRVAEVFRDNGAGVSGDLAAVFKAILLDPEARDMTLIERPERGALRTPLLRVVALLRAFNGQPPSRNFRMVIPTDQFGQGPLQSPSVFNFFGPDFSQPGEIAASGLVSPVFQLVGSDVAIRVNNQINDLAHDRMVSGIERVDLNTSFEESMAGDAEALVDDLNRFLVYGRLGAETRDRIVSHLENIPMTDPANPDGARARVQAAIHLIATSPDYLVVK